MKNVTKTNVLFTATVLVYIILVYSIRLLPVGMFSLNFLLILPEIILLVPSVLYIVFLKPGNASDYGCVKVSPLTSVMTVLFTVCVVPLISFINAISSFFVENSVDDTLAATVDSNSLLINLILLALIPAVVEEFIFRGLIFNGYKKRNPWKAAILSAALFGLIHMNINQFTYAFAMGLIFALLTYATGSIMPSIIGHFVVNGTSVVLSHVLTAMEEAEQATGQVTDLAANMSEEMVYLIAYSVLFGIALVGVVIAFIIFRFICKKNRGIESMKLIFKKENRKAYDEEQGKFFDGYLWLGIGVCVVYIILNEFM